MAKGQHREHQRIILPNGMWINLYEDGIVKIGGYDCRIEVIDVLNRSTGNNHIHFRQTPTTASPRQPKPRKDDIVGARMLRNAPHMMDEVQSSAPLWDRRLICRAGRSRCVGSR